jgi:hypothetical protein
MLIHTLIRQNADLSVDVMNDAGMVDEHYSDIYALLDIVLGRYGVPATPRTPSSSPRGGDHDPV